MLDAEMFAADDWDGEGAKAVSADVVDRANEFLVLFPRLPGFCPGADGSIGMVLETTEYYLYADALPDGRVHVYSDDATGEHERVFTAEESAEDCIDWMCGLMAAH